MRGIVAGLVVVCALGGLCLWMFSGGDDAPKAKADKERGLIKEVTPAAAPKEKPRELTAEEKEQLAHPGMVKAPNGVWHPKGIPFDPKWTYAHGVVTNNAALRRGESAAENVVEQMMLQIFSSSRGDMPRPIPANIPEWELEKMAEILITKHEVKATDSQAIAEQKGILSDVKAALRDHIKQGGTVMEFLQDYQDELERSYIRKMDMQGFLQEMADKGEDSQVILEMAKKCNAKLTEEGIAGGVVVPSEVELPEGAEESEEDQGGQNNEQH